MHGISWWDAAGPGGVGAPSNAGGATVGARTFRSRDRAPAGGTSPVGQSLGQGAGRGWAERTSPGSTRGSTAEAERSRFGAARAVLKTRTRAVRILDRAVDLGAGGQAHRAAVRRTVQPFAGMADPAPAQVELPAPDRAGARA